MLNTGLPKTSNTEKKSYDKALFRLTKIIELLVEDAKPTIPELAEEFNVTERTVQTDVYKRLESFGVTKNEHGQLCFEYEVDIKKSFLRVEEMYFLSLSLSQVEDIDEQHQQLAKGIFRKVLKKELYNPYFIKPERFQPIDDDERLITLLEDAITKRKAIEIVFNHRVLKLFPYKIASFEGIWYLMADDVHEDRLKNYMISRIEDLRILDESFEPMPELETVLDGVESAWYVEGNSFKVVIKVHSEVAEYFRLKKHLDSQEILDELPDGSLIVEFTVTHDEDVDNLIKSWLPHIEVVYPTSFKERIKKELQAYLDLIS
jgi:predicted DNA-binding transcriptional regulator YafY